jgi:hypothetical protein
MTLLKIILSFCKMKCTLSEQCTRHHPSIYNLFQDIRYFQYRAWKSSDIRLFEAQFHFGNPVASNEVCWKYIWISTEKRCLLLKWVCYPVQKEKNC